MLWTCLKERLWWSGWKPCHSVIIFFFLFYFLLWIVTTEIQGERKRPQRRWKYMWQWSCQKPYNKLENGLFQGIVVTFTFIITFSKAWQTVKEPCDGWYGLVSFSTSPRPKPSSHALPWLLDSSLPHTPSLHRTESHNSHTEEFRPACRYCSSFQISMVSCCRCPYVLPSCITRKKDFVLVQLPFFYVLLYGKAEQ